MFHLPDRATLYLSSAATPQASNMLRVACEPDIPWENPDGDVVTIDCTADQLRRLCLVWSTSLSKEEQAAIRCHVAEAGHPPTSGDLMHSRSVEELVNYVEGQWLDDVLASNRLVTFFQPIVDNHHPSRVFAHECLVRGIESSGELIPPLRLFGAARATDRVAQLDHASRLAAIRTCSEKQLQSRIFLNFNPRYLEKDGKYLEDTVEAILLSSLDPSQFVFEVVESDEIQDIDHLLTIVEYCRDVGCRVALDDMGTGYNSLYLMATVKPDFIKLDRDLIKDVETDAYKSRIAGKLVELARELRIETVVEGIETEQALHWAVRQGAEYSQGFLFARPQPEPLTSVDWPPVAEAGPTYLPNAVGVAE